MKPKEKVIVLKTNIIMNIAAVHIIIRRIVNIN